MNKKHQSGLTTGRGPGLQRLALFAAVFETGGFTAAARRLGVVKALVSQQIGRLEAELGTTLFLRTTRRVVPTDAGQRLYEECAPLLTALEDSLARASGEATPSGLLRITASADYAASVLAPLLTLFGTRHPQLQIEVVASDQVLDLVGERIDLAIRAGFLRDSSLHALKLGSFEQGVVASPEYLRRAGMPQQPHDLAAHRWVALTLLAAPLTWAFVAADGSRSTARVTAAMRVNSPAALLGLVRNAAGISVMADFTVADDIRDGRLLRLLPQWQLPEGGMYAVYPSTRHIPAKLRLFLEVLREHYGLLPELVGCGKRASSA